MSIRNFSTSFWSDSKIQEMDMFQKYLTVYLTYNDHCLQSGLYEISPKVTAFESGMELGKILEVLPTLEPVVYWDPNLNIVWIKNFVKWQGPNPSFLVSVTKSLRSFSPDLIKTVIDYNMQKHGILIDVPNGTHNSTALKTNTPDGIKLSYMVGQYEEIMGKTLNTARDAELIKDISVNYSEDEFETALQKTKKSGGKTLSYVATILESREDKGGTNKRDVKKLTTKYTTPEEFTNRQ